VYLTDVDRASYQAENMILITKSHYSSSKRTIRSNLDHLQDIVCTQVDSSAGHSYEIPVHQDLPGAGRMNGRVRGPSGIGTTRMTTDLFLNTV